MKNDIDGERLSGRSLARKARLHMCICELSIKISRKWTSARALRIGFAAANPAFHSVGYQQESFSFQFC